MDQVVAQALTLFSRLQQRERSNQTQTQEETHEPAIARAVGGN